MAQRGTRWQIGLALALALALGAVAPAVLVGDTPIAGNPSGSSNGGM